MAKWTTRAIDMHCWIMEHTYVNQISLRGSASYAIFK